MALRHLELSRGDPFGAEAVELSVKQVEHLMGMPGRGADRDSKGPGVVVGAAIGPDRVREPSRFSDLLEQPAGQASSENVVEHGQGKAVGRMPVRRSDPEDELRLFGLTRLDHERDGVFSGRPAHGRATIMAPGEAGFDTNGEPFMIEVARGGDHHVARQIVFIEERPDRRHCYFADDLRFAENLAPERVVREHRVGELLLDHVHGLVTMHENLFEDHLALRIDLFGPQRGPAKDVAEYVQPELDMLGERPHVEGRVLLGRVGVHVAAYRVDLLGDLACGPFRRSLEEEVLEKVRDPRLLGRLVARAGPDPDADAQ